MNAKQSLERYKRKAQLHGFNLGDWVEFRETDFGRGGERIVGMLDTIEIFSNGSTEFTISHYNEPFDVASGIDDQSLNQNPEDWFVLEHPREFGIDQTPPPEFPAGTKVQVIGDHQYSGAFGEVDYLYNRIATEDDREAEDGMSGWRYVIEYAGGTNPDKADHASIGAKNLIPLSEHDYATMMGGGDAPPIGGEEDLVLG